MATELPGLDIGDLEFIVKLCVNFGVQRLKFRGLEVDFARQPDQAVHSQVSAQENPLKQITDEQHKRNNKAQVLADEVSLREQQIADLQLTNPLAAEEMILSGDLDDGADGDESDE